jgi:hypothetical protein
VVEAELMMAARIASERNMENSTRLSVGRGFEMARRLIFASGAAFRQ